MPLVIVGHAGYISAILTQDVLDSPMFQRVAVTVAVTSDFYEVASVEQDKPTSD